MKHTPLGFLIVSVVAVVGGILYLSSGSIAAVPSELTGEPASGSDIAGALIPGGAVSAIGCLVEDEIGTEGLLYAKDGQVRAMATTSPAHRLPGRRAHLLVTHDRSAWIWYAGRSSGERFTLPETLTQAGGTEIVLDATSTAAGGPTSTAPTPPRSGVSAAFDLFDAEHLSRDRLQEHLTSSRSTCYRMSVTDALFDEPVLVDL